MNEIEFFVRLCGDVLVELLQYGDRRRLTKLERVGQRFHWIVENFFGERPFLCFGLYVNACFLFFDSIRKVHVINAIRLAIKY